MKIVASLLLLCALLVQNSIQQLYPECLRRCESFDVGQWYTCAVTSSHELRCWGLEGAHLGDPDFGTNYFAERLPLPPPKVDFGGAAASARALQVATGVSHTCALLDGGRLRCFGNNNAGQLGYGLGDAPLPPHTADVAFADGLRVLQVATGNLHTCVLLENHQVECFGYTNDGVLGIPGDLETNNSPPQGNYVKMPNNDAVYEVCTGLSFSCALTLSGVACWGDNTHGYCGVPGRPGAQPDPSVLGYISLTDDDTLRPVRIACGANIACAVLRDAASQRSVIKCWGAGILPNGYTFTGPVGRDNAPSHYKPPSYPEEYVTLVRSGSTFARGVAGGNTHSCFLAASSAADSATSVYCAGSCNWGECGYGNTNQTGRPPRTIADAGAVNVGAAVSAVRAGYGHTCARLAGTSELRCWGSNWFQALGTPDPDLSVGGSDFNEPNKAGNTVVLGAPLLDYPCCEFDPFAAAAASPAAAPAVAESPGAAVKTMPPDAADGSDGGEEGEEDEWTFLGIMWWIWAAIGGGVLCCCCLLAAFVVSRRRRRGRNHPGGRRSDVESSSSRRRRSRAHGSRAIRPSSRVQYPPAVGAGGPNAYASLPPQQLLQGNHAGSYYNDNGGNTGGFYTASSVQYTAPAPPPPGYINSPSYP